MIRPLLRYGHPDLRKQAQAVEAITDEIAAFAKDLIETMLHHQCIGFAAPQVGVLWRIIATTVQGTDSSGDLVTYPEPLVLINPVLSEPSEETWEVEERNPVLPNVGALVKRPWAVTVHATTLDGKEIEQRLEGMAARVVMHENDHLNGVLFIDRASSKEKKRIKDLLKHS